MPHAQLCEFSGAGRLGPLKHAPLVNDRVATHLDLTLSAGTIRGFHVPYAIHDFDLSAARRADSGRLRAAA